MGAVTYVGLIAHGNLQADRLFDLTSGRDNILERFCLLRERLQSAGMVCRTADMFESGKISVLIFHDLLHELGPILRVLKANPYVQLIYVPNEPAFVVPFHDEEILPRLPVNAVLTWNDHIAGRFPHVFKSNIGQPVIEKEQIPSVPFSDKKFICSIFANKPSDAPGTLFRERIRAIDFFSRQPLGGDLYGIGWESSQSPSVRAAYKGKCDRKQEVLKQYKFAIAYENMEGLPGLITEKIFDCFAAGTVPIYHGAPNIQDYIPKTCYIDFRDFGDYDRLYQFLVGMKEGVYQGYLDAVKGFLETPEYYKFTSTCYAENVLRQVQLLMQAPKRRRTVPAMKWELLQIAMRHPWNLAKHMKQYRRFFLDLTSVW